MGFFCTMGFAICDARVASDTRVGFNQFKTNCGAPLHNMNRSSGFTRPRSLRNLQSQQVRTESGRIRSFKNQTLTLDPPPCYLSLEIFSIVPTGQLTIDEFDETFNDLATDILLQAKRLSLLHRKTSSFPFSFLVRYALSNKLGTHAKIPHCCTEKLNFPFLF
ncbi:hypothetical protein DFS34DRAFT_154015 [Phlyctochytrium arcticum]|nr:hypothetical protein DFS34DRAFT_154015 [Phlyctochytrium arcticum]